MARKWSKKEEAMLLDGVGIYGFVWFERQTDPGYDWPGAPKHRSRGALYAKLNRSGGQGGFTRGAWTLHQLLQDTGYSRTQILRAQRALHQKWKRLCQRGAYLITDEQMDDILCWLQHDYWQARHRLYACLWCTSDKRPAYALGLCVRCYYQYRRFCRAIGVPAGVAEQQAALARTPGLDQYGKILDTVKEQLAAGRALSQTQLDWLATVV